MLYNVAPSLLFVGGAYLVLLLVVSVIDYATNPLLNTVTVTREMNSKFSLGVANIVTLKVVNRSRHPLRLRIKDDFPDAFFYDAVLHDCRVSPMHHCRYIVSSYTATARHLSVRGYSFTVLGNFRIDRPSPADSCSRRDKGPIRIYKRYGSMNFW